jgi:hypothetical protein
MRILLFESIYSSNSEISRLAVAKKYRKGDLGLKS